MCALFICIFDSAAKTNNLRILTLGQVLYQYSNVKATHFITKK